MRKISLSITVDVLVNANDEMSMEDVSAALEVVSTDDGMDVLDSEIKDLQVVDSR